eukprot:scpid108272/ scgid15406/ 
MAPVLFNIFMWAVVVKWHGAVKDIPGIGSEFMTHEGDCNLYRKTRRTDPVVAVTESQFADDSSLFVTTRHGAELALSTSNSVAAEFGLTASSSKTKLLVADSRVSAE